MDIIEKSLKEAWNDYKSNFINLFISSVVIPVALVIGYLLTFLILFLIAGFISKYLGAVVLFLGILGGILLLPFISYSTQAAAVSVVKNKRVGLFDPILMIKEKYIRIFAYSLILAFIYLAIFALIALLAALSPLTILLSIPALIYIFFRLFFFSILLFYSEKDPILGSIELSGKSQLHAFLLFVIYWGIYLLGLGTGKFSSLLLPIFLIYLQIAKVRFIKNIE